MLVIDSSSFSSSLEECNLASFENYQAEFTNDSCLSLSLQTRNSMKRYTSSLYLNAALSVKDEQTLALYLTIGFDPFSMASYFRIEFRPKIYIDIILVRLFICVPLFSLCPLFIEFCLELSIYTRSRFGYIFCLKRTLNIQISCPFCFFFFLLVSQERGYVEFCISVCLLCNG